jgi:hypothetical protein
MAQGGKVKTTPNPPRAYVPPLLDGPHAPPRADWFLICLAWFAGFITCYLVMTL